jgi:ergothioneine biosynthesis protein EgtB
MSGRGSAQTLLEVIRISDASDVMSRYCEVRDLTEQLSAPLSPEDQTVQSMPDVSPTKWHRAHTTWFFETFLLEPSVERYRTFDPSYRYMWNSYYEGVGPRHPRPERGLISRPGVNEIADYRRHVDAAMSRSMILGMDERWHGLLELGINHEQQHQELLLMDIKHVLSCNPLLPTYRTPTRTADVGVVCKADAPGWTEHDGGVVQVGHEGRGFAFDNESPRHDVLLRPFALANRPVTNAQWLAFMDDDGYRRPELWLSDGWAAVNAGAWKAPLYWAERDGEGWVQFTLGGPVTPDPEEPVCHVSYYEADAFARWAGARLPVEAEWESVATSLPVQGNFLRSTASSLLHPSAPDAPARSKPSQLFGDVWEWTASAYLPYPGFHPAEGAVGEYNGKFMVSQHVLRGGCCATPEDHTRATYRNFFPPSARWAFSGLRLAADEDQPRS